MKGEEAVQIPQLLALAVAFGTSWGYDYGTELRNTLNNA